MLWIASLQYEMNMTASIVTNLTVNLQMSRDRESFPNFFLCHMIKVFIKSLCAEQYKCHSTCSSRKSVG